MTLTRPEAAASDVLGGPYISANYRMRPTAHGAWADHLPTDPAAPAPTPHRAGDPSRPPDIVGREAELAAAANTLDGSRNVVVTGDLGVGKTALLKVVAYARHHVEEHGASYLPAGVLPVDDLLQCLYLRFFDEPLLKGNLRAQRLRGVDALVALDDVTYGDEEFAALEEAFSPGALVVARAGRPAGNTWNAMSLAGLSDDAGLALFQRKLGRQVVGRERQLARKVVRHLAGNPLRIERVATLQRETTWPLGRILTIAEGGPTAEVDELRSRLSSGDERLLEVLASLYPHIAGEDVLGAMLERFEPRLALPRFERWGLALAYSPRYRVPADVAARAEGALHPDDEMALLDGLVRWTERHRDQRSVITAEAGVVTHVLERAVAREDWDGVERLGHAVDEPLMLTGLWGTWEQALDRQLVAGRAAGNRALEAWAQHQLGTRAMGLGDLVKAKADLTQALRLRVGMGDSEGARVTRHNLGLLGPGPMRYAAPPPPPPPAAPEPRRPFPPPWWLLILPPLLVLGGLVILLFRGGDGGDATLRRDGTAASPSHR